MISKLDSLNSSKSSSFVVFRPALLPWTRINEELGITTIVHDLRREDWEEPDRDWSHLQSPRSFVVRGSRPATKALETSISVNSALKKYRLWSLKEIDFINLLNNYFTFFNLLHFNNTRLLCRQSFPVLEAFYLTLWLRVYVLRTLMSPSG